MKKILLLSVCCAAVVISFAQKETFDLTTYTRPKAWKKQVTEAVIQFTKEDAAKGTYCVITLYKAVGSKSNSKENFDMAWASLVKESLAVAAAPEMQPADIKNEWELESGYAAFEKEGTKGVALLITATGFEKMITMLILTNTNAFEKNISDFLASVSLKKLKPAPGQTTAPKESNAPVTSIPAIEAGKFAFTTTNFDDGWTSVVQEDWVQVTKENTRVLIHYPNKKADEYNPGLLDGLKNAWEILVAPRYNLAGNTEFKPVSGWQSIEFAESDAIEKASGKTVHIVLFKINYSGGNGRYLEFITPDKKTFETQFGAYHQESYGWEKMEVMINYNKFAVGASDLRGKWTNNFTGMQQYVNAYTGASAGADTHASSETFEFTADSYKWNIGVASGFVGNIKFQSAKSTGKFSMPNNWQVHFSEIEKKAKTYNAYFSCIKGARILWLQDVTYGGYTGYGKSE